MAAITEAVNSSPATLPISTAIGPAAAWNAATSISLNATLPFARSVISARRLASFSVPYSRLASTAARGRPVDRGPLFVGQPLVAAEVHDERDWRVDVARDRDVLLHLVPGPLPDVAEGVLLTVDGPLLQGQVDLADVHVDWRRAKHLEGEDAGLASRHAQLDAGEVLRLDDRTHVVGDVAKADLAETEDLEARARLERGVELPADFPVQDLRHRFAVGEQEWDVEHCPLGTTLDRNRPE